MATWGDQKEMMARPRRMTRFSTASVEPGRLLAARGVTAAPARGAPRGAPTEPYDAQRLGDRQGVDRHSHYDDGVRRGMGKIDCCRQRCGVGLSAKPGLWVYRHR